MTTLRKFTSSPGVRASVPIWIGLYGASFSGKTYSAQRIAKGIQSVVGGKIGVGDTENGRALHYASEFDFQHYRFDPPFDPLSYLALLQQMHVDGITVGVIDSGSHEHEGQGGVLEMHEAECERLAKLATRTGRPRVPSCRLSERNGSDDTDQIFPGVRFAMRILPIPSGCAADVLGSRGI